MAWIGAALGILDKGLGLVTGRIKRNATREERQVGAKISHAKTVEAENEKLRKDLAEASKPSDPADAKLRLRERLRKRTSGTD